ncbi:MAG: M20/M25/M40 family metallo-hydrolase, partial [bacterium]|nr:M20/M25/M40 family metallo-hydrolase [bacterium]
VHASLPELGENAAEALLNALHDLIGAGGLRRNLGAVVNIRHLETGWAGFAVPARARAWVDLHVPPEVSVQALCRDVERLLTRDGQTAVGVTFPTVHAGYQLPDDDPVVQAYRAAWGGVPDIFRSHSDANLFHAAGVPAYLLGPGRLETAHTEEEQVDLAEVLDAARCYVGLAKALLGRTAVKNS